MYILPDFVPLFPGYKDKGVELLVLFFQYHSHRNGEWGSVVSAGKTLGLETKSLPFLPGSPQEEGPSLMELPCCCHQLFLFPFL